LVSGPLLGALRVFGRCADQQTEAGGPWWSRPKWPNVIVTKSRFFRFIAHPIEVLNVSVDAQPPSFHLKSLNNSVIDLSFDYGMSVTPSPEKRVIVGDAAGRDKKTIENNWIGIPGNGWQVQERIVLHYLIQALGFDNPRREVANVFESPPIAKVVIDAWNITVHRRTNDQPGTFCFFGMFRQPKGRLRSLPRSLSGAISLKRLPRDCFECQ